MVDRIIIDNSINSDTSEPVRPLIHEVGWFSDLGNYLWGDNKNPLDTTAQEAWKKLDQDMTEKTSDTMQAAINAYAKIPVNSAYGAYTWSHQNSDGSFGGIIEDWKEQSVKYKYSNLQARGWAVLLTAEGEGQLAAGSLVPNESPYDLRRGKKPEYILQKYPNGEPIGYDLGSTALMNLYQAKKSVQLESYDPTVTSGERSSLTPTFERIIDDIRDITDSKHDMSYIVTQLSGKDYPKSGFNQWKQYLIKDVMSLVNKSAWNLEVNVDGKLLQPIPKFMRQKFVAKTWRDVAVLDLADIRHSLEAAKKTENITEAENQTEKAINKFIGGDSDKYNLGYKGVWQALQHGQDKDSADWDQLRDQVQEDAEYLKKYLEKFAENDPQRYAKDSQKYEAQLNTIKAQLNDIRNSRSN